MRALQLRNADCRFRNADCVDLTIERNADCRLRNADYVDLTIESCPMLSLSIDNRQLAIDNSAFRIPKSAITSIPP